MKFFELEVVSNGPLSLSIRGDGFLGDLNDDLLAALQLLLNGRRFCPAGVFLVLVVFLFTSVNLVKQGLRDDPWIRRCSGDCAVIGNP